MDDALSSRTRLYVGVLAGVAGFLHLLLVFVGLRVGHLSLAEALFGPGAVRRGALVVGSTALFCGLAVGGVAEVRCCGWTSLPSPWSRAARCWTP